MKADRAEVSWDESKKKWLVRIVVGEEVIRRHFSGGKSAAPEDLKASAVQTAADEGYAVEPDKVAVAAGTA